MEYFRANRHWKGPGFAVTVVVCLLLLALISMVQAGHQHSTATATDRCTLCLVMHSVAPVAAASVIIVLVQLGISAPVAIERIAVRPRQLQLFTRPPPRIR